VGARDDRDIAGVGAREGGELDQASADYTRIVAAGRERVLSVQGDHINARRACVCRSGGSREPSRPPAKIRPGRRT